MIWKKLFGKKDRVDETTKDAPLAEAPQETESIDVQSEAMPFANEENTPTGEQADGESVEAKETVPPRDEKGFFQRLKVGLSKTRQGLADKVEALVTGRKIDEDLFEEMEDLLIQADVGMGTTMVLMDTLRERVRREKISEGSELRRLLEEETTALLRQHSGMLSISDHRPAVIMVVGVNGAGKTTTIGKLAYRFKQEGAHVVLGAGDTFRAAAIDQLQIWAERVGVDIIAHKEGSDPAAVAFDALAAAKARNADVLILDTAGRLQTKTNLMKELGKVHKVLQRELDHPIDEILLVLDATTGQNALSQAKVFSESVPVTGIALTKLDGTAKGGIVMAISQDLQIPVKLIGVGEQYYDLQDFEPAEFSQALFGK